MAGRFFQPANLSARGRETLDDRNVPTLGGHRMAFADKTLTCRDCGTNFTFTVGEQEFHAEKGFTNEPGRCPDCRARRRTERGDYGSSRGGGGGGYGGQREMFSATCASCG